MSPDKMITMANQIATFFEPYSEEEAIDGVEGHIRSFWEPRMRAELRDILNSEPDRLSPAARSAAQRLD